jgi:hypothetical protein
MFLFMFSEMQVADVFANLAIHTCHWDWGYTWVRSGGDDWSLVLKMCTFIFLTMILL